MALVSVVSAFTDSIGLLPICQFSDDLTSLRHFVCRLILFQNSKLSILMEFASSSMEFKGT